MPPYRYESGERDYQKGDEFNVRKIYPDATALYRGKEASDEASFRLFLHETEPARQRHLARLAANEKHFRSELNRRPKHQASE